MGDLELTDGKIVKKNKKNKQTPKHYIIWGKSNAEKKFWHLKKYSTDNQEILNSLFVGKCSHINPPPPQKNGCNVCGFTIQDEIRSQKDSCCLLTAQSLLHIPRPTHTSPQGLAGSFLGLKGIKYGGENGRKAGGIKKEAS